VARPLPRVKRPRRKADHSPPPRVQAENKWSYTSVSQHAFMARTVKTLAIPLVRVGRPATSDVHISQSVQTHSGAKRPLYSVGIRIPSPILQLLFCEAYLSPPTSVQVKNPWRYTSKSAKTLVACTRTTTSISRVSPQRSPQMHIRPYWIVRPSVTNRVTNYPHYPGCISYPSSIQGGRTCSYTAIAPSKLLS
jgi:hypothetical protein